MKLKDFKNHIESFDNGTVFKNGISNPFSWRGSYDEVAFSIIQEPMTKEDILVIIKRAYSRVFLGYKGGSYRYEDYTNIHFEKEGNRNYSDGLYAAEMISKLENSDLSYNAELFKKQEKLVMLAFSL